MLMFYYEAKTLEGHFMTENAYSSRGKKEQCTKE